MSIRIKRARIGKSARLTVTSPGDRIEVTAFEDHCRLGAMAQNDMAFDVAISPEDAKALGKFLATEYSTAAPAVVTKGD